MSIPTRLDIAAEFIRQFPRCRLTYDEHVFLQMIHVARSNGVGYGWMRQAIGLAWKLDDPVGYIDDERLIALSKLIEKDGDEA
jgi:hypothetical protein